MNEWISVEDRLPDWRDGKVLVFTEYGFSICERTTSNRWKGKHANWITHWMPLPELPTEQNKLILVDNNKMLWLGKENFRCSCGGNVFSEYKDNNGKRIFECHSCKSKYEGE